MMWIPGIAIFLAVVLPWYVLVQIRNPDFFRVFILQHNLARFGTNLYHHPEPFWYFIPVMLVALLPWTVFVVIALVEGISPLWHRRPDAVVDDALSAFLSIWIAVPIVFFSISQSKLPGYILPALPAGSLLVSNYIRRHSVKNRLPRMALVIHCAVASALLAPALLIQYLVWQHHVAWGRTLAIPLAFTIVVAIVSALTLMASGLRTLRFATLIPVVLAVGVVLRIGSPAIDLRLSARPLATEIRRLEARPGTMRIAVFEIPRETEFGLAFYLNRPISRYERHEIPSDEHFVIAPTGSESVVASSVAGRKVSYLGSFTPQALDYFWISEKRF
jgi:4-amino-4-deoxy-L-arabinose transferase-like glycosyltransferase